MLLENWKLDFQTGGTASLTVKRVLFDTGASHGNYISKMWLEKKREEGYTFLTKKVDCQVVLGDNTTVQSINEQVWIPVSFKDDNTGDIYTAPIKFSVLHMDMDDSGVPLIIGLPSIGRHFTKLVIKMLERNAILYEDNDEE